MDLKIFSEASFGWELKYLRSQISYRLRILLTVTLILTFVPIIQGQNSIPHASAALSDCASGGYSSGSLTITPSHGKVMYIDTGVSPRVDAAYVGYRVTNNTGAAISGYWVSLTNFRGGVVNLANVSDANQQLIDSSAPLPAVAAGATKTVYFLLKAAASTKSAQTHTVSIYSQRPDTVNANPVSQCDFSFTKVAETIKAAANKVTSVTVITTGSLQSGQLITVEVKGATGIVGSGSAPDYRILWFSPAAYSSFPTGAVRLESVQLVTSPDNANWNNSADLRIYDERLLVTNSILPEANASTQKIATSYKSYLTAADALDGKRYYKNVYQFRVIGKSATAAQISPVAQISSGTQIKHTDLGASSLTTLATQNVTTPMTISKGLSTGSFYLGTGSYTNYVRASYQVSVTTTSTSELSVDEIIDTPASGAIFTGSASYKLGAGSAINISPIQISTESGLNPQPYHFIGPFKMSSTSSVVLSYQMYIPKTTGTYTNTASARIGEQVITNSTGYQLPSVFITTDGTGVVSTGSSTTTINPDPVTLPASVSTGSTYLNGTVDANNQSTSVTFEYGTSASLASYTSISMGSLATSSPTGFTTLFSGSAGVNYYFRIVATTTSGNVRYTGDILNFSIPEPVGTPTATTQLPLSVGSTIATIAGDVDPNLNTMTEIRFIVSTGSTLTSVTSGSSSMTYSTLSTGSTFVLKSFDATETTLINTTASGSSPTSFSYDLTGLTRGVTYYYQIEAVYPSGTVAGGIKSFKTGTTPQTISFSAGSDVLISYVGKVTTGSSSASLPLTYTSESPDYCAVNASTGAVTLLQVGTCTITASQEGNSTYSAAEPVTSSFEILPAAPSATTNNASSVSKRSATLNGTINVGGAASTDVWFYFSTNQATVDGGGGTQVTASESPLSANGVVSYGLTGLEPATTYYYKVKATNVTGTSSGSTVSFTTDSLTSRTLTLTVGSATLIYGAPAFNSTATASAGDSEGTKTWSSSTTSVCTVNVTTGVVTIVSAGTCTISASITAGTNYAAADSSALNLTIAPKAINITAQNNSCNQCTTAPSFEFTHSTLVGTDDLGSVTFTFTLASPSYNSTTAPVAATGTGNYTITPSAAVFTSGSASNYSITYVPGTYSVTSLLSQTITFTTGSAQTYRNSFDVSATSSSSLEITFSLSGDCTSSGPLTVASGSGTVTIMPTQAGTDNCSITATQGGNGTYGQASPVTQVVDILKATLNVTPDAKNLKYKDAVPAYTFNYGAFQNPAGLTIDTSANSVTTAPTCTSAYTNSTGASLSPLTISCSGGTSSNYEFNYLTANLLVEKADQEITFGAINDIYVDEGPVSIYPSASSTLAVTITENSVGVCTYSAGQLTVVGPGTCSVTAAQGGDSNYNSATSVTKTFLISKRSQVITFNALSNMNLTDPDQDLTSSTNATGLNVTLSVDPSSSGICEIVGGKIHPLSVGTCTVNSNQSGNSTYSAASQVQQSFVISSTSTTPPASTPTPTYTPRPPTITKISAAQVCAIGSQLVITGTYLTDARATVGGLAAAVISSSYSEIVISLPTQPVGVKSVIVTNSDGSATSNIEYRFVDSPVYVNFVYPSTYQGMAFTYTFTATNTEKYSIDGVMPAGLTLDPLTGEISGTPTKAGNYRFTIVASNFCDQTYLDVYMFVDKAIPQTFTCTVPFLNPRSDTVSEFRLTQLRKCLDDIYKLSPATVAPVIFISGGLRSGLTIEQSLTHPRYLPILNLITSMNLNAQIYLGAFSGALDAVQLNIYWPMP